MIWIPIKVKSTGKIRIESLLHTAENDKKNTAGIVADNPFSSQVLSEGKKVGYWNCRFRGLDLVRIAIALDRHAVV